MASTTSNVDQANHSNTTARSAAEAVWATPELVESIILKLRPEEIEVLRGVNKLTDQLIKTSPAIRFLTFRHQEGLGELESGAGLGRLALHEEIQPYLPSPPSILQLHHDIDRILKSMWEDIIYIDRRSTRLFPHFKDTPTFAEDIFLTRPPVHGVRVTFSFPSGIWVRKFIFSELIDGVTVSDFIKGIGTSLLNIRRELVKQRRILDFWPEIACAVSIPICHGHDLFHKYSPGDEDDYITMNVGSENGEFTFTASEIPLNMEDIRKQVWNKRMVENYDSKHRILWKPIFHMMFNSRGGEFQAVVQWWDEELIGRPGHENESICLEDGSLRLRDE
ncbi:hypothetical protein AA313_de0205254 [Arthrobotrys entomopaga]|nr:hypothetical protein AA313_de0205254 [Arthrobotrys entomopaga]